MNPPILYIIVPCCNETETLPTTSVKLLELRNRLIEAKKLSEDSRIIFIDDGSTDATWQSIADLHASNPVFLGLKLSNDFGHQNALFAGLTYSVEHADCMVTIDADLQDDENAIEKMLDDFAQGVDIVCGVRSSRKKDSFLKRITAQGFYKFMRFMGVDIVYNHGDFRFTSKRATRALLQYRETHLFIRGIIPLLGFKRTYVNYERREREKGESKYHVRDLFRLASNGLTSFSVKPLKLITSIGWIVTFLALAGVITSLVFMFGFGYAESYPLVIASTWLLGGIIMIMLGLLGTYVGKTYYESKHRPRFIVEETLD